MNARWRFLPLLLLAVPGRGEGVSSGGPSDVAVTLTERSVYEVEGSFHAPVFRSVAWDVLTDYENIGRFVPAVKRSWLAEEKGGDKLVGQDMSGGWMFFSRRIVLRLKVRETPPGEVSFEEVSGKDFISYAGSWRLEEGAEGTSVSYRLRAEPRFHVPGFVLKGVLRRGARELLRGIHDEMVLRGGGGLWARNQASRPDN